MYFPGHRHHHHSSPPGTITIHPDAIDTQLEVLTFGPDIDPGNIKSISLQSIDEMPPMPLGHTTCWLNVMGLGNEKILRAVAKHFNIHRLILEDIVNTWQRPKVETYDQCLFIVTRIPDKDNLYLDLKNPDIHTDKTCIIDKSTLQTTQLSICLGPNFVITFQNQPSGILQPIRQRLMRGKGQLHLRQADYLAYAILDQATDAFYPLLERYGEDVEDLETAVIEQSEIAQISQIHDIKRNLLTVRRAIWPQRDMLNALIREDTQFIKEETKLFLRDCYDHTIQLLDIVETCREIATGLVDILLSSQSNRMNEIMKVLTIIATIFIPLSWIAGVYGMNFDTKSPWNMPELAWPYGYFFALGIMLTIAIILLLWFWRKGWIGRSKK